MPDTAPVAIVTGSSRGAGRGIARALGSHGCTVYVTGRSIREGDAEVPGTIFATAQEVTVAGGKGIPVRCDHADDEQVKALIDRVIAEQGRIDILVNNACYQSHAVSAPGQFWEKPLEIGEMMNVGLRSGFVASWYAAPHMVRQDKGLIVFTSSPGAMHYCFGPSYGAQKAGVDKMAFDMGVDFADAGANIAAVSIWMGALTTERLLEMMEAAPDKFRHLEGMLESPEYTGEIAWAMYNDPGMMARWNGKVVIGAEAGKEYGLTDIAGKYPPSARDTTKTVPPAYTPYKVK
ncbi:SDR family NAD(P)-dependent oxidoreductase [Novosphingobium mangrovi (ex Huang et al. 2023)]|uniref:SDR family NAD(P)-dependent oxidoreductase n=1 Tax=Novosphingobium mangrovi (ex Huang et al. 2023) TaxID=2976432 RepID=A0ABT2I4Z7_9SPHN|nr:SDR family NAD(P)-dependent oxidoreductase [Novosphingobium mangrovi (ex Huang et al. 2023)]MCT2399881.1 SDR family NAD(P)-dependent oxidoreductase [Novosphingobium mangrovi (ex Huang et al. 2023)]